MCAVLLCAMSLAGCNRETPASPTPPGPPINTSPLPPASQIVRMNVSGGNWVVVGGNPLQMTARIYTRLNPDEYIDDADHVTWTVNPTGILAVDPQGRVTGSSAGTASVVATVGDKSASWNVRAVPEFTGTWSGNYSITGCTGARDFRTCGRLMIDQSTGRQALYPFSLMLSQLQDRVTGTLRETSPTFSRETPVSGFVREAGVLVLEASVPQADLEPFQITNWSMTMNGARTQVSGGFTRIAPTKNDFIGLPPYTLRTEHEFSSVTRTP